VLVPCIHSARLGCVLLLSNLDRLLLDIPPRLRRDAIITSLVYRLLSYNADLTILRLWHTHGAGLYTFMAYIAFGGFSPNNFRTHAVSP
jgi:hypothetical protein